MDRPWLPDRDRSRSRCPHASSRPGEAARRPFARGDRGTADREASARLRGGRRRRGPPGPVGPKELEQVAEEVDRSVRRARIDREAEVAAVLSDNPSWSPLDAAHAVDGCLDTDLAHVTELLRTDPWDLQELVRRCPVPLQLLAATDDSALLEPDRTVVPGLLPQERTSIIASGHCIHRDRPGMWLHEVLTFVRALRRSDR